MNADTSNTTLAQVRGDIGKSDLQRYARFPWGQLIALYCAVTFVMLGFDMALLHLGYQHFQFIAIMPIIFCGIAAIVSFIMAFSAWWRRLSWVLAVLAMLVGTIGTVIHLEIALTNLHHPSLNVLFERLVFDPRPPLAPAALAGTGLLLLFIACTERWPIPWIIALVKYIPIIRDWLKSE